MSNWTSITANDLKSAVRGEVVDAAATLATGGNDPVAECIADAISKVRASISVGNQLDQDATKVPNSLRGLTARIAAFALKKRIPMVLTEDERTTEKADQSYLNRIVDSKIRFELPDNPDGSAEMQQGRGAQLATTPPPDRTSRRKMRGL
jgi:hypothetical protein